MPRKPGHPCKVSTCPNIAPSGQAYCAEHKKVHKVDYARANPEFSKLYDARWRRYRKMFLAEHPVCVECGRAAVVCDHIKDHMGDYDAFWDPTNHQPLCKSCHDSKTAKTRGWNN